MITHRTPRALTPRRLAECAGLLRTAFAAAIAGLSGPALAGPEGAQVVRGSVNIQRNGANTVITAGNGAIINYQSFNIAQGETVRFIQPGAASRVLNRITGPDPSRIAGSLLANGIVYIVNPAGVFFAHGALVNVGGLYAAAGSITNRDFVNNVNQFTGLHGTVENRGTLNTQAAHLVGAHVANYGAINAPNGMVTMSAGGEVYIGEQGGQVFARVSGQGQGTGVEQAGQINAAGGQVRLGAGDMYAVAIDHPGSSRARDITLQGGRGGVVSSSGTLDASSTTGRGGTVQLLGDRVGVFGGEINASGASGGGTVLVGGDYQGHGDTPRADATFVGPSATIRADATRAGDGGKVVVWSDRYTNFQGHISAQGGALGGNGGSIETSGKDRLLMVGGASAAAPRGRAGTWLLDPTDVTMSNAATSNGAISGAGVFDPDTNANSANVNLGDIVTALQGGTSVTINTASSGAGMGDISLTDPLAVVLPSNVSLTLNAEHDINMTTPGATITSTGAGAFTLNFNAMNDVNISQAITLGHGAFNVTAGGSTSLGGAVAVGGASSTGTINVQSGGDVMVSEDLSASTTLVLHSGSGGTGNLTFAGGPMVSSDNITLRAGDGAMGMNGATVDAVGGAPLFTNFAGTAAPAVFALRQDADVADAAIPDVVQFGGGVVTGMDYRITSDAGAVTLSTPAKVADSILTLSSGTTTTIGADLSLASLSVLSPLALTGNITTTGDQSYGGAVTLGANTTLVGQNVTFAGTLDSAGGIRDLTVNTMGSGGGTTTFAGVVGGMSALGTLTTDANGTTTISGASVNAAVLDFHDHLLIGGPTVLNATTSAAFAANIDSETNEHNDLTINSPSIMVHGSVGFASNGAPGLFKTGAGGMTVLDGDIFSGRRFDFGNAVVVMRNTRISGSTSIVFRSTLDSESGMARDLRLDSPVTNFNAPVGAGAPNSAFGLLTTDAAGTTTINASAVKAATIDFKDSVVLAFDSTLTGSTEVNLEGAVDSRAAESHSLTVNSPDTRLGGVIGGATALHALTTDAAGTTKIGGRAISANTVDFHDAVVLTNNCLVTAPAGIHFFSTLDADSGSGFGMSITGTQVTFDGAVGAATDGALGQFATDAGSQVNIGGGSINALNIAFRGTTQLRANTTITAESFVRFGSTVDSVVNQNFSLTVHSPSASFGGMVGGAAGSSTALGSLTTDAADINGGAVTTLNDQTYHGAVRLGADTFLNGHNVTFDAGLDSSGSDHALTVNTMGSGITRFGGAVGEINPLASITTNVDGQTVIGGPDVFTSGDQTYNDKVVLGGGASISGTNILFEDTLDSDGTPRGLSINATGNGNTTFMLAVGGTSALDSLTVSSGGSTRLNGGTITTIGGQTYNGKSVLGTDTHLIGANVNFGGALDSGATPAALTLTTGATGTSTFRGQVGGFSPITTLAIDGKTQIFGTVIHTSSTQSYAGAVSLGENSTLTGSTVTFGSTIDATPLIGPKSLTVNSSGMTIFGGAIGASTPLSTLTTDSAGSTQIAGDVHTDGAMTFNDAVTVMHDASFTDTGTGGITFGATLDSGNGHHALSLIPSTSTNATVAAPQLGDIVFGGNVGGTTAFSSLTLGGDRTTNPTAATISAGLGTAGSPVSNFSLVINTTGAFTMGARQKMSVLGNLTINSGGTATLGDISTLGNLDVNAPAIVVRTRPGGPELSSVNNTLVLQSDTRTDYVAGGHISFSAAPTLADGFEPPAFATPNAAGISSNLTGFSQFSFNDITPGLFHVGTSVLDLEAVGASNVNLATAIAGAMPTQTQSGSVPQQATIGAAEAEALRQLGINTRSPDEQELAAVLGAAPAMYSDVPETPSPAATDLRVSTSRLPAPVVREVLADYRDVFEQNGQPAPELPRQSLQGAWDQYVKAAGDKADPLGFRAYVEAVPSQAQALYYLDGLRTLFSDLGRLGLSPIELRHAKNVILARVQFPGMSPEGLEAAITARYFGGSASAR